MSGVLIGRGDADTDIEGRPCEDTEKTNKQKQLFVSQGERPPTKLDLELLASRT